MQFVSDPDAPPLASSPLLLKIPTWFYGGKIAWTATNCIATLASVGTLVWLSYPEYIDNDGLHGINFLNVVEIVCVLLFTFDYIIRWLVTDMEKRWFMLDPANIVDLLSTLPFYLELILASFGIRADAIRIFFLFRCIRIIRLGRYHPALQIIFATMRESYRLLALLVVVVILCMGFTSTAFFFAERTEFDEANKVWMRRCPMHERLKREDVNCTQIAPYQSIPEAMYWSIIAMSTVGNAIDAPTTLLGRTIAGLTSICGVFFFAAPATVMATMYVLLRQREANEKQARKMDQRQTLAMKAQEELRRDLEKAFKSRNHRGLSKIIHKRLIKQVTTFEFEGVTRNIYEVSPQAIYVYEPLLGFVRSDEGDIKWEDDFNMTTAQRTLACSIIVDCDEARAAAKDALVAANLLDAEVANDENCMIGADPEADILCYHQHDCCYPNLTQVVQFNQLKTYQVYMRDSVPVRFVINMPHLYPSIDVIELLKETRLTVSLGLRKEILEMYVPLAIDNLMATRLIRELYEIAWKRPSDGHYLAYIHPADADMLLEGFCDQFIPTPTPGHVIIDPFVVDQQVLQALKSSFPSVRMEWIPAEAANAFFRGPHLGVGNDKDSDFLMEVNLTTLNQLDKLGFGERFRLQVSLCEIIRDDHQFQLS